MSHPQPKRPLWGIPRRQWGLLIFAVILCLALYFTASEIHATDWLWVAGIVGLAAYFTSYPSMYRVLDDARRRHRDR